MKKYEILYTSMRKVIVELENDEQAEFLAEKEKKDWEAVMMISSEEI